jgi:hypothetical protein
LFSQQAHMRKAITAEVVVAVAEAEAEAEAWVAAVA